MSGFSMGFGIEAVKLELPGNTTSRSNDVEGKLEETPAGCGAFLFSSCCNAFMFSLCCGVFVFSLQQLAGKHASVLSYHIAF